MTNKNTKSKPAKKDKAKETKSYFVNQHFPGNGEKVVNKGHDSGIEEADKKARLDAFYTSIANKRQKAIENFNERKKQNSLWTRIKNKVKEFFAGE